MKKTEKSRSTSEASTKPKKVTVKFFINQAVQPAIDGKTKRYPLYMLITYDRKNTMMRCHYGQWYKDLSEIDKLHYPGLLDMEERIIRKTIAYEMAQRGNDFDLKGLYKKYDLYATGIHILLENHLKTQLWSVLSRLEPYEYAKALNFTSHDVAFGTLLKIAKKIYQDLSGKLPSSFEQEIEIFNGYMKLYQGSLFQYNFPTIIEWIDGSAVADYRNKLAAIYHNDSSMVRKSTGFVDRMVNSVLEYRNT